MINPYRETIVTDPWSSFPVDVDTINGQAFELCRQALQSVQVQGRSTSVLLYGEAGSGKTHLLTRLRTHLETQPFACVFAAIGLQPTPQALWRHVRRSLVESLMRTSRSGRSQLEIAFLGQLYPKSKQRKTTVSELRKRIEEISIRVSISRNLSQVMEHIIRRRNRRDAIAWLKGESVPESTYRLLDITPPEETDQDPEDIARNFIKEICRLIAGRTTVVLCFDQVEAIQRQAGDIQGLFTFGQCVQALHDETTNVLMVSCIQSFFLDHLKKAMMGSNYDRLAVHQGTLNPLRYEQAVRLAEARMDTLATLSSNARKRMLQPIVEDLEGFVGPMGKTARRVLTRCADLFDAQKKPPAQIAREDRAQRLHTYLDAEKRQRTETGLSNLQPSDGDAILLSAIPFLIGILDHRWKPMPQTNARDIDCILNGMFSRIGVSFCNQRNMTSLASRLKRLKSQFKESGLDQLVLIRHSRLPISRGARKTKKYLDRLIRQKTKVLLVDTHLLAALKSLNTMLADSKAGDLAYHNHTVEEADLRQWLPIAIDGPVREFISALIGANAPVDLNALFQLQAIIEVLDKHPVIALERLARALKSEASVLQRLIQQPHSPAGLLPGPPAVVYRKMTAGLETTTF